MGIRDEIAKNLRSLDAWVQNVQAHNQGNHRSKFSNAKRRLRTFREDVGQGFPEDRRFASKIAYLRKLDPLEFEELVLQAFADAGYTRLFNRAYSGDGGIDGRVWINDWRAVDPWFARNAPRPPLAGWCGIQCKRYSDAVKVEHLRAFPEALAQANLAAGFFVHTGRTPKTEEPWRSAHLPPVRMVSGKALVLFLEKGVLGVQP